MEMQFMRFPGIMCCVRKDGLDQEMAVVVGTSERIVVAYEDVWTINFYDAVVPEAEDADIHCGG